MVTKSVPNSGKLSLMNMELTPLVLIMVILISNSKESMFTITKPLVEDMSPELSSWISNQELWIQSEPDLSVNSSDLITSSSDKPELETIGLKVIILKVLN